MFRNVLVAFDGSPTAERALREAIALVEASRGRLTVALSLPGWWTWSASALETVAASNPQAWELDAYVNDLRRRACALVPESTPVTTVLERTPTCRALSERARIGSHDLIVLSGRRRRRLRHARVPVRLVTR
jgi:nucleotide-binding universal stress UspA family protein